MAEQKTFYDDLSSFEQGCNSGVSPLLLARNTLAFGLNTSVRGTFVHTRPPMFRKTLNFGANTALQTLVEGNFFQGGGCFRPSFGQASLVAQIGGRLFTFTDNGTTFDVVDITVPGDPNNATTAQVWMRQLEKWLGVWDGTTKLPIFFDGVTSRRSYGPSQLLASGFSAIPGTVPAAGQSVQLEISSPYTGAISVPVFFNGHYYQVISSVVQAAVDPPPAPVLDTAYQIVIKSTNAVAGEQVLVGSNLVVVPQPIVQTQPISNSTAIPQTVNPAVINNVSKTVLTVRVLMEIVRDAWRTYFTSTGLPAAPPGVPGGYSTVYPYPDYNQASTVPAQSIETNVVENNYINVPINRTVAVTIPYSIPAGTEIQVDFSTAPAFNTFQVGGGVYLNVRQTYDKASSAGTQHLTNTQNVLFSITQVLNGGQSLKLTTTAEVVGVEQWNYAGGESLPATPYNQITDTVPPGATQTTPNKLTSGAAPGPAKAAIPFSYQGVTYAIPAYALNHFQPTSAAVWAQNPVIGANPGSGPGNGAYTGNYTTPPDSQTNATPFSIVPGQTISLAPYQSPNVLIATVAQAFQNAAVGAQQTINVASAYTGPANQTVVLDSNGKKYIIVGPFIPAPYVPVPGVPQKQFLTLSNLTDVPGDVYTSDLSVLSVPELPAGRMGAYGQSHAVICLTDGISFFYGDTLGGPSGTPAHNYRDSVLKTTENAFLNAQGAFRIPNSGEIITSMTFVPLLDASLGQGPLQVGTQTSMFSCLVPNDRTTWASMTSPILPMSLKGKGPVAQNSTIVANSDTLFRTADGLASLRMARSDFQTGWSNTPISREVDRLLARDNQSLLSYGSAVNFDNRYLHTIAPQVSNQGVFHVGAVALNFDPVSNLRGKLPSIYDADAWTGINVLQWISGLFNGLERCFAFVWNFDLQKIELWELLKETTEEYLDNGTTPIAMVFETPVIFNPKERDVKDYPLLKLDNGKIYLSRMKGNIHVKVQWRPDFYPCWTTWHERDICVRTNADSQEGYLTVGLGEPPAEPCDESSQRPLFVGRFFQLRISITGKAQFEGGDFSASVEPVVDFPPPVCGPEDCRVIQCTPPDDLRIYSLSGLPPVARPPVISGQIYNQTVYFNPGCGEGTVLTCSGALPGWITIDLANNRLVGAANTFVAGTLIGANTAAQEALNLWAQAALAATTLTCASTAPGCDGMDTNQYAIDGYVDGMILNPTGDAPTGGEVVWDGTYKFKSDENSCAWMATYFGGPKLLMDGRKLCNALIEFDGGVWGAKMWKSFPETPPVWKGEKPAGSSPAGNFDYISGVDAGPATLSIVSIGGATTDQPEPSCIPT